MNKNFYSKINNRRNKRYMVKKIFKSKTRKKMKLANRCQNLIADIKFLNKMKRN